MSTPSSNYNFVKPAQTDNYDVDVQNSNWDKADSAIKNVETSITNHASLKNNPHGVTAAQVGAETPTGAQSKVDAHAGLTSGIHGATSVATANTIMQRDASGRAQVAAPSAAADIARKAEVDAIRSDTTKSMLVEVRTSDPVNPEMGRIWFRSDL